MKDFWNERYGRKEFIYGRQPNEFFAQQLSQLNPGSLLLPAEGEGRNAIYAAALGWEVTAFDFSEEGKKKAEALAQETGVQIDYQIAEASTFEAEPASFDAIALIYAHFPPEIRQQAHRRMIEWLRPGGTLILEAFRPEQLGRTSGGPKNKAMLYDAAMLADDFLSLNKVLSQEIEVELQEGDHHAGKAEVVRFVARKPKA
ncbi:MAG: class I SAM-dependent methyltransferase [bacterium]